MERLHATGLEVAAEFGRGFDADARSDQFSFCVALWEGLYGSRPFGGDSVEELQTNWRAFRDRTTARFAKS